MDDDNDTITISTDDELQEAIALALAAEPSVLRLTILALTNKDTKPPATKGDTKPPVFSVLLTMSGVDVAKVKEHFKRHDTNSDGCIDAGEFNVMLKRMGVLLSATDERRLFDAMDKDHSGSIEINEFVAQYPTIIALEKRAEEKQIENLRQKTTFSTEEIQAMYHNFKSIACTEKDDGLIDKDEFRRMMVASDSSRNVLFYDALFRMFDRDGSNDIDFSEFVSALAVYHGKTVNTASSTHSPDVRAKFFFGLCDTDGDGFVSKSDLTKILADCLASNDLKVTAAEVANLVDVTFANFPGSSGGMLDFNTFKTKAISTN